MAAKRTAVDNSVLPNEAIWSAGVVIVKRMQPFEFRQDVKEARSLERGEGRRDSAKRTHLPGWTDAPRRVGVVSQEFQIRDFKFQRSWVKGVAGKTELSREELLPNEPICQAGPTLGAGFGVVSQEFQIRDFKYQRSRSCTGRGSGGQDRTFNKGLLPNEPIGKAVRRPGSGTAHGVWASGQWNAAGVQTLRRRSTDIRTPRRASEDACGTAGRRPALRSPVSSPARLLRRFKIRPPDSRLAVFDCGCLWELGQHDGSPKNWSSLASALFVP